MDAVTINKEMHNNEVVSNNSGMQNSSGMPNGSGMQKSSGMPNGSGMQKSSGMQNGGIAKNNEKQEKNKVISPYKDFMRGNYNFFGLATAIYALFFVLCMHGNDAGITFPVFIVGSMVYFKMAVQKIIGSLKKDSIFYGIAIFLLGISTFMTDSAFIIFFNKVGIYLLALAFLLNQFCNTSQWGFGKYFSTMILTSIESLGELINPVEDAYKYFQNHKNQKNKKVAAIFLGVLVTLPVLGIVLALLSSADAIFGNMINKMFECINLETAIVYIIEFLLFYFAIYAILSHFCNSKISETVTDRRTGEPIIAITMNVMLSVIYLIFSGIQILYLFMGNMTLPEGYTYASYAREGFYQLLAVSIINLVIVLVCKAFFKKHKLLNGVLVVMSVCTYIMIASSALRMMIYIQYYYVTLLRVLVLWALIVLTFLFTGIIINIFHEKFALFSYGVFGVTVLYIMLSFAHPDYWVAKINLANAALPGTTAVKDCSGFFKAKAYYNDYSYLRGLSLDAAPAVLEYLQKSGLNMDAYGEILETGDISELENGNNELGEQEKFGKRYLKKIYLKANHSYDFRKINLSRNIAYSRAKKLAK